MFEQQPWRQPFDLDLDTAATKRKSVAGQEAAAVAAAAAAAVAAAGSTVLAGIDDGLGWLAGMAVAAYVTGYKCIYSSKSVQLKIIKAKRSLLVRSTRLYSLAAKMADCTPKINNRTPHFSSFPLVCFSFFIVVSSMRVGKRRSIHKQATGPGHLPRPKRQSTIFGLHMAQTLQKSWSNQMPSHKIVEF